MREDIKIPETKLVIAVWDRSETDCDGCGKKIPPSEKYISDIESCCGGGCVRNLCVACVRAAAKALEGVG